MTNSSKKWGKKKDGLNGWMYSKKTFYICKKKLDPDSKKFVPYPGITNAAHQEQALTSGEGNYDTQGSATVHLYSDTPDSGLVGGDNGVAARLVFEKESLNGPNDRI